MPRLEVITGKRTGPIEQNLACLDIRVDFRDTITYLFLSQCPSNENGKDALMESYYRVRCGRHLPYEMKWGTQPLLGGIDRLVRLYEENAPKIGLNAVKTELLDAPRVYRLDISIANEFLLRKVLTKEWGHKRKDCRDTGYLLLHGADALEVRYLNMCNMFMEIGDYDEEEDG